MMKFSVIVCTAHRTVLLPKCLESLVVQTLSPDDFELIVINNTPDNDKETQAIIQNVKTRIKIRYALEEEEGLSNARNRGISMAHGEILAFIDDDAIADINWLQSILSVYECELDVSAVGGKVCLLWEKDIPKWLHPRLYSFLSELNYGDEIIQIQRNQPLNGCNFSIKRSCIEECGGFSHRLGRNQRTLLSGEETELLIRIQLHSGKCYYAPKAFVYHLAAENRMNKHFFRKRAYWGGRSSARIDTIHFCRQIFGTFFYKVLRIPYYILRSIWAQTINNSAQSFLYEIYSWLAIGYVLEVVEYFWVIRQLEQSEYD